MTLPPFAFAFNLQQNLKVKKSGKSRRRTLCFVARNIFIYLIFVLSFHSQKLISMADEELSAMLNRRNLINEGAVPAENHKYKVFNPYTEFPEFTRKEIKEFEKTMKKYDTAKDGFLDLQEMKLMMEKLGAPQTHLALKQMIAEVDEDKDDKINFREFLLIYRKARQGELDADSGLGQLAALTEIDVNASGVGGAKNFFEAKIEELSKGKRFEEEIRAEQDEKKKENEEKQMRKKMFKEKALIFAS